MIKVTITNNYEDRDAGVLTYENGEIKFDGPEKDMLKFMLDDQEFHWNPSDDIDIAYSTTIDPLDFIVNLHKLLTGSRFTASEAEYIDQGIKRAVR